jgi:hypothetical protein
VEDVRSRRRAVGTDLADVGRQIAGLLEGSSKGHKRRSEGETRPVSES